MPWSAGHKTRTRTRILDAAADVLRRQGYFGVGLKALMRAAGLTPGAFYAHFPSKEALFAAVIGERHDFTNQLAKRRPARGETDDGPSRGFEEAIDFYLSPDNLERVAAGCSLTTLSNDLPRSGPAVREAFDGHLHDLAAEMTRHLPKQPADERAWRARAVLTLCVGGVTLARGFGNERERDRWLAACRHAAYALAAPPDGPAAPAPAGGTARKE